MELQPRVNLKTVTWRLRGLGYQGKFILRTRRSILVGFRSFFGSCRIQIQLLAACR